MKEGTKQVKFCIHCGAELPATAKFCPDCGKVIRPYGESRINELAAGYNTDVLAQLPIDPELASLCDKGVIELFEGEYVERAADIIEKKLNK